MKVPLLRAVYYGKALHVISDVLKQLRLSDEEQVSINFSNANKYTGNRRRSETKTQLLRTETNQLREVDADVPWLFLKLKLVAILSLPDSISMFVKLQGTSAVPHTKCNSPIS